MMQGCSAEMSIRPLHERGEIISGSAPFILILYAIDSVLGRLAALPGRPIPFAPATILFPFRTPGLQQPLLVNATKPGSEKKYCFAPETFTGLRGFRYKKILPRKNALPRQLKVSPARALTFVNSPCQPKTKPA